MSGVIYAPGVTVFGAMQGGLTIQYLKAKSPTFNFFSPQLQGEILYINPTGPTQYNIASNTIQWNPTKGLVVYGPDGSVGVQSAAMGLLHEISHKWFGHNEAQATAWETRIALELGEPLRANYNAHGQEITLESSTKFMANGTWNMFLKSGNMVSGGLYNPNFQAGPQMGNGLAPPGPPLPGGGYFVSGGQVFIGDNNLRIDTSYPYQPGVTPGPNQVIEDLAEQESFLFESMRRESAATTSDYQSESINISLSDASRLLDNIKKQTEFSSNEELALASNEGQAEEGAILLVGISEQNLQ